MFAGPHRRMGLAATTVATGRCVCGEYRTGMHRKRVRFEDQRGETPHVAAITHRIIADRTAAIHALLAGELDMVASVLGEGPGRSAPRCRARASR